MVRILSETHVESLLSVSNVLPVVETAMIKQSRGEVTRPERPHFPVGKGIDTERPDEALGTGLTMPAYIHGTDYYTTKLASHFSENKALGLPTITSQIVVNDAKTGLPIAVMDGTYITAIRTGCIGGLATRELAEDPVDLAVIGAGTQARWQTRAISTTTDLKRVRVYSPTDSRFSCANELNNELDARVEPAESPREAVKDANVVVTATSATSPVIDGEWLEPDALVIAIGAFSSEMQEIDQKTISRACTVFADVPEEAVETGDLIETQLVADDLIPLGDLFLREDTSHSTDNILVVKSVGSSIFDAATATHVVEMAKSKDIGECIEI